MPSRNWGRFKADRDTNTGYTYDTLGRTTTLPATDAQGIGTHAGTSGALTLGYNANDMVASETQGTATQTLTLDPRRNRINTSTDGTTTTTNHYSDDTDSPAWASSGDSTWTRNLTGTDGNLAATADQTGTITLQLCNMHGDIVATAADSTSATAVNSYNETTEYGKARTAATAYTPYGYLGTKQRSGDDLGGLMLMGARLYNPSTGRFESPDPVYGGNANSYIYPDDPVGSSDINGLCSWYSVICLGVKVVKSVGHALSTAYHWTVHVLSLANNWAKKHRTLLAQIAVSVAAGMFLAGACVAGGCEAAAAGLATSQIAAMLGQALHHIPIGPILSFIEHNKSIRHAVRHAISKTLHGRIGRGD